MNSNTCKPLKNNDLQGLNPEAKACIIELTNGGGVESTATRNPQSIPCNLEKQMRKRKASKRKNKRKINNNYNNYTFINNYISQNARKQDTKKRVNKNFLRKFISAIKFILVILGWLKFMMI